MKKIGILALALIMAVGSLGVGLAHWSGTLDINGTVTMEHFCFGWYQVTGGDPQIFDAAGNPVANPDDVMNLDSGVVSPAPQDIGWSSYVFEDWICDNDVPDWPIKGVPSEDPHYGTVRVTVNNAYPGYYIDYEMHYHNSGLPIDITSLSIVHDPQIEVRFTNGGPFPHKVETCQTGAISLEVWCLQPSSPTADDGVQPNQSYSFLVTYEYQQHQ